MFLFENSQLDWIDLLKIMETWQYSCRTKPVRPPLPFKIMCTNIVMVLKSWRAFATTKKKTAQYFGVFVFKNGKSNMVYFLKLALSCHCMLFLHDEKRTVQHLIVFIQPDFFSFRWLVTWRIPDWFAVFTSYGAPKLEHFFLNKIT